MLLVEDLRNMGLMAPQQAGRLQQPPTAGPPGPPQPQRPMSMAQSMANSPGWAMAMQGISNIGALSRGQQPGVSPIQAYQQHVADKQKRAMEQQRLDQQNPFFAYEQAKARGYIPQDMSYLEYQSMTRSGGGPTSNMRDITELARLRRLSQDESLSEEERKEYGFLANTMQESIARSQMYTGPAGATGVRGAGGGITQVTTPEEMMAAEAREKAMLQGVEMSKDVYGERQQVQKSISNMNDAIAAIDAGADTGPIMRNLPSLNAASIELDNIRNRMGLDIVGQGSFGALSESELEFALATAIPDRMEEDELRDWLVRKRDAQQKLLNELTESFLFLNQGGTLAELYKMKRGKSADGTDNDAGTIPGRE